IETWLHPEADPTGSGFQTLQSLYAIGSGGPLGVGLGQSTQKHLYIPEPQNDYIFAIVCEELGFVGAMMVIVLFLLLIWRGFVIAYHARDKFGSLLVVGIVSRLAIQTILNIAVVTNSLPPTGISLPFFSYGGTSLLILLFEMGVVLSVSRYSRMEIKE
ncbi:MAG: FtsW/RodA/SpoVE family cell cycle protein, partial [Clostridia bacterium]|nr:FtsW/RodA/SpoVE family cell cycle protein [Clostridia bacterium]